jgi:hypothetical protein
VDNKPFALAVLALIVLIALAVWQFYSLAWGDGLATTQDRGGGAPRGRAPRPRRPHRKN